VRLETEHGHTDTAEHAARLTEDACLVSLALDVPVHVTVKVATPELATVA
jgi:hypothetical protein